LGELGFIGSCGAKQLSQQEREIVRNKGQSEQKQEAKDKTSKSMKEAPTGLCTTTN
jgi:hypothetical protein